MALSGCFLVATGFNAYLVAPASVLPLLVAEFGVDKPTAGLAVSAVYLGWVLTQLPAGLLMDRYDNRLLVVVALFLFVLASLAGAVTTGFRPFLLTRFLGGTGAAFLWTANANVVSRVFPTERRAFATSLFVTAAPVGFGLAQLAGPMLADAAGWRAVQVAYPLVALAGLPPFLLALPDPVRNETRLSLAKFARTLRDPAILLVSTSSFCASFLFLFYNSWMPSFATDTLGVSLAAAGAATSLVPITGVLARPVGGLLSDRVGGRRPVLVGSFLASLPIAAGVAVVGSFFAFAVLLALAGFAIQLGIGVFFAYASELGDRETSGTSLAVLTTIFVLGSLLGPVLGGWLVESYSWLVGFGFAGLLAVAGAATILLAPAE